MPPSSRTASSDYADNHDPLGADKTSRLSRLPALRLHLAARARERAARRQGRRGLPPPALLARLLPPRALPLPAQRAASEFQERYRGAIEWSYAESGFEPGREGRTGFPLVDAGMRQLLREGWMHNRARLVVGSFLTKDLGIDWRWGERWFMRLLIDGDEANNNGNWQWIASRGGGPPAGLPAHLQPGAPHGALRPRGRVRAPLRAGARAAEVPAPRAEPELAEPVDDAAPRCQREAPRASALIRRHD